MRLAIENNVGLAPHIDINGTGRAGTALASKSDLMAVLGNPHQDGCDEKTTAEWYFGTPRGPATLHDYWWNAKDEWSIGARDIKAARWLAAYLRMHGFRAKAGALSKKELSA